MTPTIYAAAAITLYLAGAFWHWQRLTQTTAPSTAAGAVNALAPPATIPGLRLLLGLVALGLHGLVTMSLLNNPAGADLSLLSMSTLVALVVTLFTLLASLRLPIANLMLIVFPLSALALAAALLSGRLGGDTAASTQANLVVLSKPLLSHIIISICAYSILTIAAAQSVLLAVQERQLKNRSTNGLTRLLPPMETMERLLFALLWVGLATLTVAIGSGFAFLDDMFAQNISHHTILACLAWVVFAVLLYGHKVLGWRGFTAVRWTLAGFALLLLGYFGSKFVAEILLGR